jgi:hypothetical protein
MSANPLFSLLVPDKALSGWHSVPRPTYRSPVDTVIGAHQRGELTDQQAVNSLLALGDQRSWMYNRRTGRCKHLGPYPGCSGGCNRRAVL